MKWQKMMIANLAMAVAFSVVAPGISSAKTKVKAPAEVPAVTAKADKASLPTIELTPLVTEDKDHIKSVRFSKAADKVRVVFDLTEDATYKVEETPNLTTVYFSKPFTPQQVSDINVADDSVSAIKIINGTEDSRVEISTPGTTTLSKGELKNPYRLYLDFDKDYEYSIVKEVMPGLTRIDMYSRHKGVSQAGHMLEVDWKKYRLAPILGGNGYLGKNTVANMVRNSGAIAGENASYFGSGKDIYGVTKIDGKVVSTTYLPRTAFGITSGGEPIIGEVSHNAKVVSKLGDYIVAGINSTRSKNGLTLYNHYYGAKTPASADAVELIIADNKVQSVKVGGDTPITPDTEVLSATGDYKPGFGGLQPGEKVVIEQNLNTPWDKVENILGVGPTLVKDGKVDITTSREQIGSDVSYGRAPRTAVGILANGNVLLAVVDGRQSGAKGMTLNEFADMLVNMTVKDAVNFDGGGSSEMVLQGKTINAPSDGSSRYVATALGVFAR